MVSQYNTELIRNVLDGRILTVRRSTNDEWASMPDSTAAIRYLLECDHSPAYCRTKSKPITKQEALGALEDCVADELTTARYDLIKQFIEEQS